MPALSKSRSSRRNIIPYLRSCSSKLSLTALSSTTSFTALFSSSNNTNNNSSRDLTHFNGGTLDKCGDGHLSDIEESQAHTQGKENASPSKAAHPSIFPSSSTFKRLGLSSSNSKSFGKTRSNLNLLKRSTNSNSVRGASITISKPTLTPESLAHMNSKFNLVPITNDDNGLSFGFGGADHGSACGYGDLNGGSPSPSPSRNLNAGVGGGRLRETVEDDVVIISIESSRRLAVGSGSGVGVLKRTQSRVPAPLATLNEIPDSPQVLKMRI